MRFKFFFIHVNDVETCGFCFRSLPFNPAFIKYLIKICAVLDLQEAPSPHCLGCCYFCSPFVVGGCCEHYYLALHLWKEQDFTILCPPKKRKRGGGYDRGEAKGLAPASSQMPGAEVESPSDGEGVDPEPEYASVEPDVQGVDPESEHAAVEAAAEASDLEADPEDRDLHWDGQGKPSADDCLEKQISRSIRMWEFFGYKKFQRAKRRTRL